MESLYWCAVAFLVGLGTDLIWSRWLIAISEKRAFHAANWSVLIYLCSFIATYLIIKQELTPIICYLVGGYIGTYVGVSLGKPK